MILTVDPGLVAWAYAVFDEDGNLVTSETIAYKSNKKLSQEIRLWHIWNTLASNVDNGLITEIVAERQFVDIMQQITGVVRAVAGYQKIGTTLFTPMQWKKLATGKGNISEEALREIVVARYPELKDKSEHEIDCAGIYLAFRKKVGE